MTVRPRFPLRAALALVPLCSPLLAAGSGAAPATSRTDVDDPRPQPLRLEDAPVSTARARLLELAFESASALPHEPHIKNRSRAQEAVVEQYLALDQPNAALRCVEAVDNWRKGLGYANLAFYCAEHGDEKAAEHFARLADALLEETDEEREQNWRKDRIRVRVAQAYALIGDGQRAAQLEADVVPSESGKVETIKASMSEGDEFDTYLAYADAVSVSTDFDHLRNAIDTCAELFSRYYADAERRAAAEDKVKLLWEKLPRMIRIDIALDLSGRALAAGDREKALALALEGLAIKDSVEWTLEDDVALGARLARARFEAGDQHPAYAMLNAGLEAYQAGSEEIVDIYRADALRPLAEGFSVVGDREGAALVYRMALEEGVHNPNSRPRAEDLSATCLSMVSVDFEPGEELWERLVEIREALGAPW